MKVVDTARPPVWRSASVALGLGGSIAALSLGSPFPWALLTLGLLILPSMVSLRDTMRPQVRSWRAYGWWAAWFVGIVAPAAAAAISLGWSGDASWVGIALGGATGAATFGVFLRWGAEAVLPVLPDASTPARLDPALADPLTLRLLGVLACYQGIVAGPAAARMLECDRDAVDATAAALAAAGHAELAHPDAAWGGHRPWMRATPAGRTAFDAHVAALREAAGGVAAPR